MKILSGSWQHVGRRDCGAKGTSGMFTHFAEVVDAAVWTAGNFSCAVELEVRCKVVREINPIAVG